MEITQQLKKRLLSLDVFRGLTVAAMILVNNPGDWGNIYSPLGHSHWNGCTPTDLIFPFFLFIMGVSITYALSSRKKDPAQRKAILLKIFKRTLILFALGYFLNLFPRFDFATARIPGVLQRIALVYLFSALLFLRFNTKGLIIITAVLLVGYNLIMTLVPVPGVGAPNLEPETNLGAWLDRLILTTDHLWSQSKTWDPEGILSTLPAIGTGILGILCGTWLRKQQDEGSKIAWLFVGGFLAILAGMAWNLFFPINKSLWTSSFVLYAAGWASCLLAVFYWLIDVNGYKKFTFPFVVYGINAISVFFIAGLLPRILSMISINENVNVRQWLYNTLFVDYFSPINASLTWALVYVLFFYGIVWIMYKKDIIIKI